VLKRLTGSPFALDAAMLNVGVVVFIAAPDLVKESLGLNIRRYIRNRLSFKLPDAETSRVVLSVPGAQDLQMGELLTFMEGQPIKVLSWQFTPHEVDAALALMRRERLSLESTGLPMRSGGTSHDEIVLDADTILSDESNSYTPSDATVDPGVKIPPLPDDVVGGGLLFGVKPQQASDVFSPPGDVEAHPAPSGTFENGFPLPSTPVLSELLLDGESVLSEDVEAPPLSSGPVLPLKTMADIRNAGDEENETEILTTEQMLARLPATLVEVLEHTLKLKYVSIRVLSNEENVAFQKAQRWLPVLVEAGIVERSPSPNSSKPKRVLETSKDIATARLYQYWSSRQRDEEETAG
jgi:hypothetical protein